MPLPALLLPFALGLLVAAPALHAPAWAGGAVATFLPIDPARPPVAPLPSRRPSRVPMRN